MTERTTVVDQVLNTVGFIIIAISVFASVFILIRTLESSHSLLDGSYLGNTISHTLVFGAILNALGTTVIGTVTGCLFIGFAAIIRLLDQIRWQGEMALNNDGKQTEPH
jgi:ABC-type dipeptide/oligopeptide/nickel transport system permease component